MARPGVLAFAPEPYTRNGPTGVPPPLRSRRTDPPVASMRALSCARQRGLARPCVPAAGPARRLRRAAAADARSGACQAPPARHPCHQTLAPAFSDQHPYGLRGSPATRALCMCAVWGGARGLRHTTTVARQGRGARRAWERAARARTPGSSGLASCVSWMACRRSPGAARTTIARESPTLAVATWSPATSARQAVVPLSRASKPHAAASASLRSTCERARAGALNPGVHYWAVLNLTRLQPAGPPPRGAAPSYRAPPMSTSTCE